MKPRQSPGLASISKDDLQLGTQGPANVSAPLEELESKNAPTDDEKSKHFSELNWPSRTLEEFRTVLQKTNNGETVGALFEAFLEKLQEKDKGSRVWYDLAETDDSQAPE